jgi:hypothetical protein
VKSKETERREDENNQRRRSLDRTADLESMNMALRQSKVSFTQVARLALESVEVKKYFKDFQRHLTYPETSSYSTVLSEKTAAQ